MVDESSQALTRALIFNVNMIELDRMTGDIQDETIKNIRKQLSADDINFTGGLSKKIEKGKFKDFRTVDLTTPYAKFVEYGLPPGNRPNFDALRYWVENKLGVKDENELTILTLKISNKITTDGIKPKRFVKKALKSLISRRGIIKTRRKKVRVSGNAHP